MLHLGSVGGTSIDIDFSFFFLLGLWTINSYDAAQGVQYALLWIPVIFISVLLHEFAHAGMFGLFGCGASHIVLGGIGGVTINGNARMRPWQDMFVSVAGPLTNFALAFLCGYLTYLPAVQGDPMLRTLMPYMQWANIVWGVLNLLPIPPLDGGHAVRGLMRSVMREGPAFVTSVWIAILAGIVVVVWSVARKEFFITVLIGWYTFNNFQAWEEYRRRGYPGE